MTTLDETLVRYIKAGESLGEALDITLDVMRKTPHTRLKKYAFEMHYGREPNTEISNMLNVDKVKVSTKKSVSAKPDTLQVYSFNGAGVGSDQLPMKQKKGTKGELNNRGTGPIPRDQPQNKTGGNGRGRPKLIRADRALVHRGAHPQCRTKAETVWAHSP